MARRVYVHGTGRKSAGCEMWPGLWERGTQRAVPHARRSPGPQGRSSPVSVWRPRATGARGAPLSPGLMQPLLTWPGAASLPCSCAWQRARGAEAGGSGGSRLVGRGGWPAAGGRPRAPRRCPSHLATRGGGGLPRRRGAVWRVVVQGDCGASRRGSLPAPAPNKGLHLTASSLRSSLAPASGSR